MIRVLDPPHGTQLRQYLQQVGFQAAALEKSQQIPMPPDPASMPAIERATRAHSPMNTLIRLFILGQSLPREVVSQLLPESFLQTCLDFELLDVIDQLVSPQVCLMPMGELLLAADTVDKVVGNNPDGFVLPPNTHSAGYLNRCVPRSPVHRTLDLGCGCGVHALFAAGHSEEVIAIDINPAAVAYTQFNAVLNDINNVTVLEGDLFEPVAGQQFDLIISNPPFVLSPDSAFTYQGNPMNLDDFCRMLVRQSERFLREQGQVVMLGEWVEKSGVPWSEEVNSWLTKTSACDALLLRNPAVSVAQYVDLRLANSPDDKADLERDKQLWRAHLESKNVTAINPCVVVLRKNSGQDHWREELLLTGNTEQSAAVDIRRCIEGQDFLAACVDDESLLEATLRLSDRLQVLEEVGPDERPTHARIGLQGGLALAATVEISILAFLAELDGKATLHECLDRFCSKLNADRRLVAGDLLAAVRTFVRRAFVIPAELGG